MIYKFKKMTAMLLAGAMLLPGVTAGTPVVASDAAVGNASYSAETDAKASSSKPMLSVDKIELTYDVAKASPVQKINVSVSGADGKYAVTGLHIYWDSRLTASVNKSGYYATAGNAVSKLSKEFYNLENGVFATTASQNNDGADGVMYTLEFTLPDNIQVGDVFDISIKYEENELCGDLFTDSEDTADGKKLQEQIFSKGISNGYIKITEPVTTTTTTTTTTAPPVSTVVLGDVDSDGIITAFDASLTLTEYTNLSSGKAPAFSDKEHTAADVDKDTLITAYDASLILSFYTYLSGNPTIYDIDKWAASLEK